MNKGMNKVEKVDTPSSTSASEIMSRSLITIPSKSNMYEVAKKMCEHKISAIFLTSEEKVAADDSVDNSSIVGIITHTDLAKEICAKDIQGSKVDAESVMRPLIAVSETAKIEEAVKIMNQKGVKHIAVRDSRNDQKILGIISTTDLARYLKRRLMQNQNTHLYFGEELSVVDVFGEEFPEPLPSDKHLSEDEQC
jgi:CBS domain-containing protein